MRNLVLLCLPIVSGCMVDMTLLEPVPQPISSPPTDSINPPPTMSDAATVVIDAGDAGPYLDASSTTLFLSSCDTLPLRFDQLSSESPCPATTLPCLSRVGACETNSVFCYEGFSIPTRTLFAACDLSPPLAPRCAKRAEEPCCVDVWSCNTPAEAAAPTRDSVRLCSPNCESIQPDPSLEAQTACPGASSGQNFWITTANTPCSGDFVCDSVGEAILFDNPTPADVASPYDFVFWCENGSIQRVLWPAPLDITAL